MPTPNGSGSKFPHGVHVGPALELDAATSAPAVTTNKVYFVNGVLYADGVNLETGAGGGSSWETIYSSDSTFALTSGTWTITQGGNYAILTLNKTANGSGAVIDITNSGTGKDISGNGGYWSVVTSATHGVLELGSTGTINATDGALTIGKAGTATTFSGTVTVDQTATITGALTATASLTITGSADSNVFTITNGDAVMSNGKLAITNDDTDTILALTGNSVTTGSMISVTGNGVTSGDMVLLTTTDAGFSGNYLRISDGSDVFTIGDEGATTIVGAGGSTVFTVTAGDLVVSDGSLAITDADDAATFSVTNNTATSASVVVIAGSGTFTGSTTTSFATLTASGLTSGTVLYVPAAALTTGKVLDIAASAATDGILVNVVGGGANMTATGRVAKLSMGAGTVGQALEVVTTGAYTGAGVVTVTADSATTAGATVGQGVVCVSADALTTGTALDVTSTSIVLTSGRIADFSHISGNITGTLDKTGDYFNISSFRTVTTGTVADDYDMLNLIRTSVINGAGSFSATGSVLYVENAVTNTSGTVTDTVKGIEVVMDSLGSGDGIEITHNAVGAIALDIVATALTTGKAIDISDANAVTTGIVVHIASSAAGTQLTGAGRLLLVDHTGAASGSGTVAEFKSAAADETVVLKVTATAALAAGVLVDLSPAALTTGKVIDISDLDAITTGKAIHIDATGVTQTDGILVHIDSASTALTSTGRLLLVDHTGNAGVSNINSEFKSAAADETVIVRINATAALAAGVALDITGASVTTGTLLDIGDADALSTGGIAVFASNSADNSARSLVKITNDNTGATGTVPLRIQQDAPTSTNYWKVQTFVTTSGTVTLWMGNGTTGNGNLSGTAGDILFNGGSNKPEYCSGTTSWTALV